MTLLASWALRCIVCEAKIFTTSRTATVDLGTYGVITPMIRKCSECATEWVIYDQPLPNNMTSTVQKRLTNTSS